MKTPNFLHTRFLIVALVLRVSLATPTVFTSDTPAAGSLDMIVDGVYTATEDCLTMEGDN